MQILPAGLYFYLSCKGSINILIYTKKDASLVTASHKILALAKNKQPRRHQKASFLYRGVVASWCIFSDCVTEDTRTRQE